MSITEQPVDEDVEQKVAVVNTAFAEATRPAEPEIREPEDGSVRLTWGFEEPDGERHTYALVRELTGADEEAISRIKKGGDLYFAQVEDVILKRAVESIGDIPIKGNPLAAQVLSSLLMGDRGMLLAAVLKATYGNTKEYEELPCPHCGEKSDIEVDIDAITKVSPMIGDRPEVVVPLRKGGELTLRFPTGEDQMAVLSAKEGATEEEQNTLMIARCITTPGIMNKTQYALQLGAFDRKKIVAAMVRNAPALSFEGVSVPCPHCSETIPFVFGWADLLFN